MRKFLFLFAFLAGFVTNALAESEVLLKTSKKIGENFTFSFQLAHSDSKVLVDWGDGVKAETTPSGWSETKTVSGNVKGEAIRIYGKFKLFEVPGSKITSMEFVEQDELSILDAHENELDYYNLHFSGALNITNLNLDKNQFARLDLRLLKKLQFFSIKGTENLSTVIMIGCKALQQVVMEDCDITHFYGTPLPNLKYLRLANNNLTELELGEYFPKLATLDITGNEYITDLDVSNQENLEKLYIGKTGITEVNLVNNTKLIELKAENTGIEKLDLSNNKNVTLLQLNDTKLKKLDVLNLSHLRTINLSNTRIKRVDFSNCMFLEYVYMNSTNIQFLDLNAGYSNPRLKWLSIKDCKRMTPQSLNYTYMNMPPYNGAARYPNVFLAGSNAEHSKTSIITSDVDHSYKTDVTGDGTASMEPVNITMETPGVGTYTLEQIQDDHTWKVITGKAVPGYPIRIKSVLPKGKELLGVKVNDEIIDDNIFVISSNAVIKPILQKSNDATYIALTVPAGIAQEYSLAADQDNTEIYIDWGNGEKVKTIIGTRATIIDGTTSGTTVKIYGDVTDADFASLQVSETEGTSNRITGVDVTHNLGLRKLSTFMNNIGELDVYGQTNLEELDCSYCGLTELNLDDNKKLTSVKASDNKLTFLDLTFATGLTYLDVKNNQLNNLNLDANPLIETLICLGNNIGSLEVSAMNNLKYLDCSNNQLAYLNVAANTLLETLYISNNKIEKIDVTKLNNLNFFAAEKCKLQTLDFTGLDKLTNIRIGGNNFTPCALNDIYVSLSEHYLLPNAQEEINSNLQVAGNDAEKADSKIATEKGWKIDVDGDGTGCDHVYIFIKSEGDGTVKVFNGSSEVENATKVAQNSELRVEATPNKGMAAEKKTANGVVIENDKFVAKTATTVYVKFAVSAGIKGTSSEKNIMVAGGNREINFTANQETQVAVYTTNGKLMFNDTVNGSKTIGLPAGIYIVKTMGVAKQVLVK